MCEMSLNLIAHRTAHHSPGEREYGNPKRTKLSTIFMVKTGSNFMVKDLFLWSKLSFLLSKLIF